MRQCRKSSGIHAARESNILTPHSAAKERVIVCVRCYQLTLRCDPGEPCKNCGDEHICERAKCENFEAGTCRRMHCLRAHEDDKDRYKNLVDAGHTSKLF